MADTPTDRDYMLYGHPTCPMVLPVRTMLGQANIPYTYVNIHEDDDARARVREINGGHEGVPVVVFPDGSTLTEPGMGELRRALQASGERVPAAAVWAGHVLNYRFVILPLVLIALLIAFETVV